MTDKNTSTNAPKNQMIDVGSITTRKCRTHGNVMAVWSGYGWRCQECYPDAWRFYVTEKSNKNGG